MPPPTTYSFEYVDDNLLTKVRNPITWKDYPGNTTLVRTRDGEVSTLAQYRRSRRSRKKASEAGSVETVDTVDPETSYPYSADMEAAMLSGTTLGADVTPNEGNTNNIDDTKKKDGVSDKATQSQTVEKQTLTSTIKGLYDRH